VGVMISSDIRILYVEDEVAIREVLVRFIQRFATEVFIAKDGDEGLKLYNKHKPDIVVSDINMPVMNGLDMAKAIKDIKPNQHIIFTTAHSDSTYFMEAIEMQADGYILKPITLDLFKKKIDSIISIINLKKDYDRQHTFMSEIAQLQDNMLVLLDEHQIPLFANEKFLKHFKVTNIEDFIDKNIDISSYFINYEGFYFPSNKDKDMWIDELSTLKDDKRMVSMVDFKSMIPKAFLVYIKKIKESFHTIITFSEITNLASKKREFEVKAYTDELTRIGNRAKFNSDLSNEIHNYKNSKSPLSIIMLDIDYFKKFNDNYGHQIGDEVLIELASIVSLEIRSSDIFARWGGEEFIILLPNTNIEQAKHLAQKIRQKIQDNNFVNNLKVTSSFGVAQLDTFEDEKRLLKRVDDALYRAKDRGRNRVEV
jgi:diguanylate cyclase (GGDEF)-like protein